MFKYFCPPNILSFERIQIKMDLRWAWTFSFVHFNCLSKNKKELFFYRIFEMQKCSYWDFVKTLEAWKLIVFQKKRPQLLVKNKICKKKFWRHIFFHYQLIETRKKLLWSLTSKYFIMSSNKGNHYSFNFPWPTHDHGSVNEMFNCRPIL